MGAPSVKKYDSFIVHSDADEMEREGVPWKYYQIKKYCQLMLSSYLLYTRISIKNSSICSSFSSYQPSPVSSVSQFSLYAGTSGILTLTLLGIFRSIRKNVGLSCTIKKTQKSTRDRGACGGHGARV